MRCRPTLNQAMCKEDAGILRKVVDANPQLVFIKDWDGRFVLANQAVAELYGSTPEELEGKTDADFNANAAEVENYLKAD
jgi:two-component system sensor histidine kinase/response regulator